MKFVPQAAMWARPPSPSKCATMMSAGMHMRVQPGRSWVMQSRNGSCVSATRSPARCAADPVCSTLATTLKTSLIRCTTYSIGMHAELLVYYRLHGPIRNFKGGLGIRDQGRVCKAMDSIMNRKGSSSGAAATSSRDSKSGHCSGRSRIYGHSGLAFSMRTSRTCMLRTCSLCRAQSAAKDVIQILY
jgi:hypothetical protein